MKIKRKEKINKMKKMPELFGNMVFNDEVMKERLPKDTYSKLKKTIKEGSALDIDIANAVANAMKEWAMEKGVTHYTHWFQPMTGVTAEKHESFLSPTEDGIIMEFSGKELIQGEPDASSFPSGGLRATFEARGYTAWDPTSYAFIKDNILCIPTAFCSYSGEVLDKKTPLLRSMEAINKQALRVLKVLGRDDIKRVSTCVGAEQEYFLVERELYEKRPDLVYTGRTLFGAKPPKGQELEDHYFGAVKRRVSAFMKDLDEELWKVGVYAKTKHNEVAPAQHELAPVFTTTNIATDHNQIIMEYMKRIAKEHGMMCLLDEKPFENINGSGKHNNWSITTDAGENLLKPGKDPSKNLQFLIFLSAVIKAVDEYQDLLRVSVATAGNDHRLGANEAPPAIMSIFLGDDLLEVLEGIEEGKEVQARKKDTMLTGVEVLPDFAKDTTDRNRTSPFAFTGNKFEFRMLGSSQSIAGPNIMLNTIVAEELSKFADVLEKDASEMTIKAIVKDTMKHNKRIIFNGNNYSDEWVKEAKRRGLLNLSCAAEALPYFAKEKNINVFVKHKIFSREEVLSRTEIMEEEYSKIINIEALTMIDMAKTQILPSSMKYLKDIAKAAKAKKEISESISIGLEEELIEKLSSLNELLYATALRLEEEVSEAQEIINIERQAKYYHDKVSMTMSELRGYGDALETIVDRSYWPYPVYGELLFSIQ